MNSISLKRVELEGVHQRYDLDISFNERLNILHGHNGTGKSTLIHIIANAANCDFVRFAFLDFKSIRLTYYNGRYILIRQDRNEFDKFISVESNSGEIFSFTRREANESLKEMKEDSYLNNIQPELIVKIGNFLKANSIEKIETSYFPAFRTMLEAWSSQNEYRRYNTRRMRDLSERQATSFARNLFGPFLPHINYPSPMEIEDNLANEIRDCQIKVARYEGSIFSESFVKVFSALLDGTKTKVSAHELLNEISQLTRENVPSKLGGDGDSSNTTYRQLQTLVTQTSNYGFSESSAAGALTVYRDAIKERHKVQREAFEQIDVYFDVVNSFLEKKELSYTLDKNKRNRVGLKFPDGSWSRISVMSSGERQLLTMLYAVNRISGNSVVLIDEPEISLHIDWQEDLLEKMMEQLGDRQIIVCTHSPAIAADFHEFMTEVSPKFNDASVDLEEFLSDDEEDY